RLKSAGFTACLVGGSVRDLLLGREPKDFDVATDAHPEQIRELFRNSRLIGRRFRLAHVRYGDEIIEVSTFRAGHGEAEGEGRMVDGRILRDNVYGSMDEDVWRRDFSVNALYYNIEDFTVVDYAGGMADIRAGRIRLIGDPVRRYIEDPVRLLRAVRFKVKLGFRIDPESEKPIPELAHHLADMPPARLFEEVLKLFTGGCALQTFVDQQGVGKTAFLLRQYRLGLRKQHAEQLIMAQLLESFLIAALLWTPVVALAREYMHEGMHEHEAGRLAGDVVVSRQVNCTAMPRRFTQMARDIWQMQYRLSRTSGKRPQRTLAHPRFRAGYDFLLLRAAAGEDVGGLADWWTRFLAEPANAEAAAGEDKKPGGGRRRRPRRRGRRKSNP
ncbi:MAG: polynucleotide adenylyltransferase PcnB, partial [Gammaproteobacteria bacterium]